MEEQKKYPVGIEGPTITRAGDCGRVVGGEIVEDGGSNWHTNAPTLTKELLRDIIDLRIAIAMGDEAMAQRRADDMEGRIRDQGCGNHAAEAYRDVFEETR